MDFKDDKVTLIERLQRITEGYYEREGSVFFNNADLTIESIFQAVADYQGS